MIFIKNLIENLIWQTIKERKLRVTVLKYIPDSPPPASSSFRVRGSLSTFFYFPGFLSFLDEKVHKRLFGLFRIGNPAKSCINLFPSFLITRNEH